MARPTYRAGRAVTLSTRTEAATRTKPRYGMKPRPRPKTEDEQGVDDLAGDRADVLTESKPAIRIDAASDATDEADADLDGRHDAADEPRPEPSPEPTARTKPAPRPPAPLPSEDGKQDQDGEESVDEVAEKVAEDEPLGEESPASPTSAPATEEVASPRRSRAFVVALVTLLVLIPTTVAGVVVVGLRWYDNRAVDARADAAVGAARQAALNLTSINFKTADADVNRVVGVSTGDFRELFTQNLDAYVVIVKENEVVTTGQVTDAGVRDINGTTANIILAVHSKVRNKAAPEGEARTYRMALRMEHQEDGTWLVSRVDFVP
jgi:Mce-associated membrane protein